jgi:hypothetical protein
MIRLRVQTVQVRVCRKTLILVAKRKRDNHSEEAGTESGSHFASGWYSIVSDQHKYYRCNAAIPTIQCDHKMKIIGLIHEPNVMEGVVRHLGLPVHHAKLVKFEKLCFLLGENAANFAVAFSNILRL